MKICNLIKKYINNKQVFDQGMNFGILYTNQIAKMGAQPASNDNFRCRSCMIFWIFD